MKMMRVRKIINEIPIKTTEKAEELELVLQFGSLIASSLFQN